jgi:hypothetical protein
LTRACKLVLNAGTPATPPVAVGVATGDDGSPMPNPSNLSHSDGDEEPAQAGEKRNQTGEKRNIMESQMQQQEEEQVAAAATGGGAAGAAADGDATNVKTVKKRKVKKPRTLNHIGNLKGITPAMRREIRKGECTVSELATISEKELMELEQEWLSWKPGWIGAVKLAVLEAQKIVQQGLKR